MQFALITLSETAYSTQVWGRSDFVMSKSLLCPPRQNLFDQKYSDSNIVKNYYKVFVHVSVCRFDSGKDGFIDLMELKLMMEKLGAPQTHLGLKNMIKEVDEDYDGKLSYREVCVSFSWYSYGFVKSIIIRDD